MEVGTGIGVRPLDYSAGGRATLARFFRSVPLLSLSRPHSSVLTLRDCDTLSNALTTLGDHHVMSAPVLDDSRRVVGMTSVNDLASAVVAMADTAVKEAKLQSPDQAAELVGMLQAQWKARTVGEVVNISDRSPFVPLPASASVWDALEQLGQGGAHSVVVMTEDGESPEALFSQSALVAFLFHHLHHFSSIARKMVQQVANLAQVGSPHPLHVPEDAPLLDAFRLIRDKGVTGVMVVQGRKLVGVISASDVRALGSNMEGCAHLFTSAGNFVREVQGQNPLLLSKVVSCTPVDTVGMVMEKMLDNAVHRVFVVRTHHGMEVEVPVAVMALRDVLLFQPDA